MARSLVVVLTAGLVGCGKTNAQAIEELKPTFAPLRAKLAELAKSVREAPAGDERLSGLVYDAKNEAVMTATILPFEQLADPDLQLGRGSDAYVKRFDPIAGGEFLHCLNWTGPKNPMAESGLSARRGDELKAECERAAKQVRFVVVVETVQSVVPTLVSDGQFVGGAADLRVSVVDRTSGHVLSRFEVHGQPDQVIRYAVKPGESKAVEAAVAVHGSMWVDARKKLFDGLVQRGATVTE